MRLSDADVTVVGLGLMGASLALALDGRSRLRTGVSRREDVARHAVTMGAVDSATTCLREGVADADVVVLATPVRHILQVIPEVGAAMKPGALLLDLGSTKGEIVGAMSKLPEQIGAIGGHPMCGKETGGLEQADARLYRGATFALSPTGRTTDEAMELALEIVRAVGARPLLIDAGQHDRAVAVISHVPYLLASALVQAESQAERADPSVGMLAASGFRDTTRLAASEIPMMLDILLTNREAVEEALSHVERHIAGVRGLLADEEALRGWLQTAQEKRRSMYA